MIEKLMSLNHFTYKKPFSGSDKGNRFKYIIQMVPEEEKKVFRVTCWEGEKNSVCTPDEEKQVRTFEFTEEGYEKALEWLREQSDKISII